MNIVKKTLEYQTEAKFHFIDITDDIAELVESADIQNGMVMIFCPHTTVAIKINEKEDGFQEDFKKMMSEIIPEDRAYKHNDLEIREACTLCDDVNMCINGDSHILQMLVGTASECVPLENGAMQLGKWQRIFLIELDQKRPRKVDVQIMGE